MGGNRVQPLGAPGDRLLAGDAIRPGEGRTAAKPFVGRAAGGVSHGSEAASTQK